jgi:hypothetical protein
MIHVECSMDLLSYRKYYTSRVFKNKQTRVLGSMNDVEIPNGYSHDEDGPNNKRGP